MFFFCFSSYTCSYISASYCSANSLVVKNVLYRVLKTIYSLDQAMDILTDYIMKHDCGHGNDNKYALLVTADTFGSILTATGVLLEAAKYEYTLYTSMAGSSGYAPNTGVYGRASGGSSSAYPYGVYMVQGPYRYTRNAVPAAGLRTPAMVVG